MDTMGNMPRTNYDNRIYELRQKVDISQARLGTAANTTPAQIQKLEAGTRRLTIEWMRRLAPHLGCKPSDLMLDGDVSDRLDSAERELVALYRRLSPADKSRFQKIAEAMQPDPQSIEFQQAG